MIEKIQVLKLQNTDHGVKKVLFFYTGEVIIEDNNWVKVIPVKGHTTLYRREQIIERREATSEEIEKAKTF